MMAIVSRQVFIESSAGAREHSTEQLYEYS